MLVRFLIDIVCFLKLASYKQIFQICITSSPSITDRSESINQHMNSVNLTPIDIPKKTFEVEDNLAFDSSKLDISCDKKKKNDDKCCHKNV